MLDALSMFNDELMELLMEEKEIPEQLIKDTIRKATISREFVPVMLGSAYKNKAIQPLLNAVTYYLPAPNDVENVALDLDQEEKEIVLASDENHKMR